MTSKPNFELAGKRFPAETRRTVLIYLGVSALYGLALATALWAGSLTAHAMHGSNPRIPTGPWALAFALMISGMLAVVYAFFFRPRELRVADDEVRYVMWDGTGKSMKRAQLEDLVAEKSRVVLRGGGKQVVIDRRFAPWEALRAEITAWAERKPA